MFQYGIERAHYSLSVFQRFGNDFLTKVDSTVKYFKNNNNPPMANIDYWLLSRQSTEHFASFISFLPHYNSKDWVGHDGLHFWMRKLRLRQNKQVPQGHISSKRYRQDLDLWFLTWKAFVSRRGFLKCLCTHNSALNII